MKLRIFTQTYSADLPYHIEDNLENYKDANYDWLSNADTIESGYDIPDDLCEQMCNCYNQDTSDALSDASALVTY